MTHQFRDGKCAVLKKEMKNCLILPKGTLSPIRDSFLSKEGFEKLKDVIDKDNRKKGTCIINRQDYDDCYIVPMNVLTLKRQCLISHSAISGIGAALSKAPEKPEFVEESVQTPEPPIETTPQEPVLTDETEKRVHPDVPDGSEE